MVSRKKTRTRNTKVSTKKSIPQEITTSGLYAVSIIGFLLSTFYISQYSKGWATGIALLCVIIFISVMVLMEKGE